ncbi:MAG: leucine-rich repeat protein [Lachnospiraceae bacterium]|nr:leucine-rich repeat protein [Lachnospiraceae bacterium]
MNHPLPWPGIELGDEIGYGSYGTVYQVTLDGQTYALKTIHIPETAKDVQSFARQLGGEEAARAYFQKAAESLLEELSVLQKLSDDPHIVSLLDYRMQEGEFGYEIHILMDRLESFTEYETTHLMEEKDAIQLGIDLCSALESCEKNKILHRDLKPENILVTEDGAFQLCDFGDAKILRETLHAGSVRGTFSYMSPDVYHGKKYDHRADIYSLGMILYQVLNQGKEPFLSEWQRIAVPKEREKALGRRMNGEALPAPSDASEAMTEILLKACAYAPEKRYKNAAELKKDLLALQEGRYHLKGKKNRQYAKKTKTDYLKIAAIVALCIAILIPLFFFARYEYREHFINYCDTELQREMEETYGLSLTARLNGNGVLTIDSNDDFYSTGEGMYPWTLQKDHIKKIVFGKDVTGYQKPQNPNNEAFYFPSGSNGLTIAQEQSTILTASREIFKNCRNLTEVVIEGDSFDFNAVISFMGCPKLERIECPQDAEVLVGWDTSVISETPWYQAEGCHILGTTLVRYNTTQDVVSDIPTHLKRIGEEAFRGNESVREVVLPDDLEVIEYAAFKGCTNLSHITIPEGVKTIDSAAFADCVALEEIVLPASLESLEYDAFHGCAGVQTLTIAEGNLSYLAENGVLYDHDQTKLLWCSPAVVGEFVIPNHIKEVSNLAFVDASNLQKLTIPAGTLLSNSVFGPCPALTEIVISEENPSVMRVDDLVLSRDGVSLLFCLRDAHGIIEVPDGVHAVMEEAFSGCTGVTEIYLPDAATHIMSNAFDGCTGVQAIHLPGSLSGIMQDAFIGCTSLTDIYFGGNEAAWEALLARMEIGLDTDHITVHFAE